ncbi:putative telomerase-binding protein est1a protein [Botrytis fragariae]|uniref:Putative telomerase-binding protein est1a protein n=1 Tax=Botrytis fragariae TaxID=1964551 RepID=A0A8H6ALC0_9HELO|nr:putative telomerase-binding protein est1a protein [Botrytis fragariae]KAF5869696.1 putative telomerase-binding protein est1a protein [Botrytis fragariae]
MNRTKQDVGDPLIQHLRRNTKTTKTWACIYCPDRAILLSKSDLWMHAQNNHQDKLPSTPEKSKQFRKSCEVNSVLKYPTRLCEKGHLHDEATTEGRSNKRTAEGGGIPVDLVSPFREDLEIPPPPPRKYRAKQRHDNESPHSGPRFPFEEDKFYSQRETRPITQEELVAEVKGFYANLVMVEAKPIEVDEGPWQALIKMLHTLSEQPLSFFRGCHRFPDIPNLRRLASEFAIPAEVWQRGTSSLLKFIGNMPPIPYDTTLVLEFMTLFTMAKEYDLFEDLGSSPGDEEEHHELSLSLKERKERTPCRAREILPNKIWSHNLSSPRNKPTNESTKHRDNEVHNAKLKTHSGRARSKEPSPKGLLLTLTSLLGTLLAALGHKKGLFTSLLMASVVSDVSGRAIPPENSETTISPTFSSDSNPFQSLIDKNKLLLDWSYEAGTAMFLIIACALIRRYFCKEEQNRLLSATCMAASTSLFAYLRDREDITGGVLAGVSFAGAVFTWNTFSMGVKKYNFGAPYIIFGMILGMAILWRGYPYIQPFIGSVKIDVFILPSITCSFSILEMVVKIHDDIIRWIRR